MFGRGPFKTFKKINNKINRTYITEWDQIKGEILDMFTIFCSLALEMDCEFRVWGPIDRALDQREYAATRYLATATTKRKLVAENLDKWLELILHF